MSGEGRPVQQHRSFDAAGAAGFADVGLVVNVYERTWRPVVEPGWWDAVAESLGHEFSTRTIVIANVDDLPRVRASAEALVHRGELDEIIVVDEVLDDALASVGLTRSSLGRISYFSEWAFAMLASESRSTWLCHFDPELEMVRRGPWIERSIGAMERDARIAVAMPSWGPEAVEELERIAPGIGVGYGFTDQIYLARRAFLSGRIYGERCPASLRFPLTDIAWIFEARVDAYLRNHRLLRLVNLETEYRHPPETGGSYPARTLGDRWRRFLRKLAWRRVTRFGDDPETAIIARAPTR